MDCLPSTLITKIFSFLPGEDVSRFTQLNSLFCQLITADVKYLKRPLICVEIFNYEDNPEKDVAIVLFRSKKVNKNSYDLYDHCSLEHLYEPQNFRGYSNFFGPFFEKNCSQYTLQSQFKYMLEKADIDELSVVHLSQPKWISSLSEAINTTSSARIHTILVGPNNKAFPEIRNLLEAVAHQKQKLTVKPSLRIGCLWINIKNNRFQLQAFNEIASLYSSARCETVTLSINFLIRKISKAWKRNPFSLFHFHIHLSAHTSWPSKSYFGIRVPGFKVKTKHSNDLFRVTLDDTPSYVWMQDLETGNKLEFKKRNGPVIHCPNGYIEDNQTFIVFIKAFM